MGRWAGRLWALLLGAPLALAFPRPGWWWLALVGLVPLLLLAMDAPSGPEAGVRTWLGGTGFLLAVNAFLFPVVGPFMVPLAMLLGVTWLPVGWLTRSLLGGPAAHPRPGPSPGRLGAALVLVPAAFVVGEAVRSWDALGGPWGLLGASQWNAPVLLSLAALGGVWAVSFLLVAVNLAVAAAVRAPTPGPTRALAAAVAAALPLAVAGFWAWRPPPAPAGTARVAFVQPGVVGPVEERFRASERLSRSLPAGVRPDLLAWGESSVGRDPSANPGDVARLAATARAAGAPVLAGVDAVRPGEGGGIYKSALLVGPDGVLGSYDKMRLVPFGEYVPLRPLLGWVTRFTDAAKVDRHRGTHLAVLDAGGLAVGPLICFESAFPDLARNLAARGAEVIVVQTADTTFQGSWGLDQHASLSAVRAVESGRPVVQAAISGTSAAFDARGRRLAWAPASFRGAAVVTLPLTGERTPYVRVGDVVPLACGLALAVGAVVAAVRRRRGGVSPGDSGRRTGSTPRSLPARPRP
jgi:apolipoprotein N-acyltransferase